MNKHFSVLLICLLPLIGLSQQSSSNFENPIIEVIGFAENKIIPNEIYITLTLQEYYKGRKLISISQQEELLIDSLLKYDIPKSSIKSYKASANYSKIKLLKKGTLSTSMYSIIGKDAKDVKNVFTVLKSIKIQSAYIEKVNHTELETFKKEIRIEAIKDAKTKATYLLNAIDQKLGPPLLIREINTGNPEVTIRGSRPDATDYYIDGIIIAQYKVPDLEDKEIEFKNIEIESNVFIKFKIK